MPDINLSPYTAESAAIARKMRLAEALQQQALSPLEMPTMAGVPISPYAGLAKMLQAYSATRMRGKAEEREKTLADTARADTSADFGALLKGLTPTAAVPEGPSTFTANVDQRDIAENPRMQMMPETDYEGGIIPAGQPGAGNFGVTPGAPAIPASAGRLTAEGFGAMKTPAGQQQYMAQLLAQMKPKEPIKLGKDDVLFDPVTLKPIYQPAAKANFGSINPSQYTPESVKAFMASGGTDFSVLRTPPVAKAGRTGDLGVYDEYVTQETKAGRIPLGIDKFLRQQKIDARPPANITYGSPVAAVDASGKPVFIQPGRAGGAPAVMEGFTPPAAKLKDVPPTVNTAMTQNQIVLNKLDRIDNLLVKTPDATGILKGITPGIILNRFDKEGTALRAALTELAATKVHDLSGAAVTASEFGRLKPFLPQPTDDANTIKTKLAGMKAEIQDIMNATNSIYSEDQGYKPIPNLAPKPAETPPISALKEGQTTTFKNGQSWTLRQGKPVQVK
jgi:hypothetical protein